MSYLCAIRVYYDYVQIYYIYIFPACIVNVVCRSQR